MSIEWILSSAGLILMILLIRFFLRKKITPCLRYGLWLAAALRLLLPVSVLETDISILNLLPRQEAKGEAGGDGWAVSVMDSHEQGILPQTELPQSVQQRSGLSQSDRSRSDRGWAVRSQSDQFPQQRSAGRVLRLIWLLGAVGLGSVFLAVNLNYAQRLRRCRKRIPGTELPIAVQVPVYEAQMVQAPCLSGLFAPAVYIMEGALEEDKTLRFILCHEHTHYRQGDHWWALVRILCLCLHWFNPLVWLAARLSRLDGELSCDEKTLRRLGEQVRVAYGKTLLEIGIRKSSGISALRISTSMSGSGSALQERLRMIVNTPKRNPGMRILVIVLTMLLSIVTFTGRTGAREKTDADVPTEISKEETAAHRETQTAQVELHELDTADGMADESVSEPPIEQQEKSVVSNAEAELEFDEESQLFFRRIREEDELYSTTYYRYGEDDQFHMVRYVEENFSKGAVFAKLDLTYVEDGFYTLAAVADETELCRTLISMAKQSLAELYRWTGEKVETASFQVTDMGSVYFGMTPEDIRRSRIFYSRSFGTDTAYNLSNYDKSISSMYVTSGRSVWYSPVLWRVFPENPEEMTQEEIIAWYLERAPLAQESKVKRMEKSFGDTWTVQTQNGLWFEVGYDAGLKEVTDLTGPYPEIPVH